MKSELLCVTALQDGEAMSDPQSLEPLYLGNDDA